MSPEQFVQFKKEEQYEEISIAEAEMVILSYSESSESLGIKEKEKNNCLSFLSFCNYIFSPNNSIIDPKKSVIYQDMTQPMQNYYIYSSHNTYLSGNQLNSDSQTEMYEMALKKGCRCVELDIHVSIY
jgi:phosphatidylinositol phospholipase C delta